MNLDVLENSDIQCMQEIEDFLLLDDDVENPEEISEELFTLFLDSFKNSTTKQQIELFQQWMTRSIETWKSLQHQENLLGESTDIQTTTQNILQASLANMIDEQFNQGDEEIYLKPIWGNETFIPNTSPTLSIPEPVALSQLVRRRIEEVRKGQKPLL